MSTILGPTELESSIVRASSFPNLVDAKLLKLTNDHGELLFPSGTIIQASKDQKFPCYYVKSGLLKIYLLDEYGAEVILFLVGPGELVFNQIQSIPGFHYFSISTLSKSSLMPVCRKALEDLVATDIAFTLDLMRIQSQYLAVASDRFRKDQSDALNKVLATIVYIASKWSADGRNVDFIKEIGHQQCSILANVARETFTRTLIKLKGKKYLVTDENGKIYLSDNALQHVKQAYAD